VIAREIGWGASRARDKSQVLGAWLEAAVALYFMWYNFGRVHQILRVTPAMEAGISDHVWTVDEILALLG